MDSEKNTGSYEDVSWNKDDEIKPWLSKLCAQVKNVSSPNNLIYDEIMKVFDMRKEYIQVKDLMEGLHNKSIDDDDVSFFTPRVNHHGVNLANEAAKTTIVKQFERVMKKQSFGNTLTCVVFYRDRHDEKADAAAAIKAKQKPEDKDENQVSSQDDEGDFPKFIMHKECQSIAERKEKTINGVLQRCGLYPSSFLDSTSDTPLSDALRKAKKDVKLGFLDGLHRTFGFLLNEKEIQDRKDMTDEARELALKRLMEYQVNVEYYCIKHDWDLDEEDIGNFEFLFQKWSSVIGKEAQYSNDRSIQDIFDSEFISTPGNEWLLTDQLLKKVDKTELLLRKTSASSSTSDSSKNKAVMSSYKVLQCQNQYHEKIINDLLQVNYIETLITSKFQKKNTVQGGYYREYFSEFFGAFVNGYLDYREPIMIESLTAWFSSDGNENSTPKKSMSVKQYTCEKSKADGKPLQFNLNWMTICLVRCLEPLHYSIETRKRCEKFFHKMESSPDAFTHFRLMALEVCADTFTEEFLCLFINHNKAVNGGAKQKYDKLGKQKNGQTNHKLEVTRMIRNNILSMMYEVYHELSDFEEQDHTTLYNVVKNDIPPKCKDLLEGLHDGVRVTSVSSGMAALDNELKQSNEAYSMKSIQNIDYIAVWYGRFILQLNYSKVMRCGMNPHLDTMINKAKVPKNEFKASEFINLGRSFNFMAIPSVKAAVAEAYKRRGNYTKEHAESILVYQYGPVMNLLNKGKGIRESIADEDSYKNLELKFDFTMKNVASLLKVSYNDKKMYSEGALNPCDLGNFFTFPDKQSKAIAEGNRKRYSGIDGSVTLIYEPPDENVQPIFFGTNAKKAQSNSNIFYSEIVRPVMQEWEASKGWKRERLFRDLVDEVFLSFVKESTLNGEQSLAFSIDKATKGTEILGRFFTKASKVQKHSEFFKDSRSIAVTKYIEKHGDSESDLEPFEEYENDDEEGQKKKKPKRNLNDDLDVESESSEDSDDENDEDNVRDISRRGKDKGKKRKAEEKTSTKPKKGRKKNTESNKKQEEKESAGNDSTMDEDSNKSDENMAETLTRRQTRSSMKSTNPATQKVIDMIQKDKERDERSDLINEEKAKSREITKALHNDSTFDVDIELHANVDYDEEVGEDEQ